MLREFARLLKRGSVIAAALALAAFAGKASAIAYVGTYDPQFQEDFTFAGWRGTVTIDVPISCGDTSGLTDTLTRSTSCNLTFLGATVEIYEVGNEQNIYDTLIYPSSTLSFLNIFTSLNQVSFVNGDPTGINGLFGAPAVASNVLPNTDVYYWLSFQNFIPVLSWGYICPSNPSIPLLCVEYGTSPNRPDPNSLFDAAWVGGSFQRVIPVPEPGSLALLLSALGALGLVRFRKGRTAATPA